VDYATVVGSGIVFETGEVPVSKGNCEIFGIDYINKGHLYG
jgi:hypothetical protein